MFVFGTDHSPSIKSSVNLELNEVVCTLESLSPWPDYCILRLFLRRRRDGTPSVYVWIDVVSDTLPSVYPALLLLLQMIIKLFGH